MKNTSFFAVIAISIIIILFVFSCKTEPNKEKDYEIDSQAITDSILSNIEDIDYFSFPSSKEMFSFIKKDAELVYRTDLVNPTENISKYIDTKSKTLALGVYLTDLTYMSLFNKTSNSYDYIDAITKLSNDLRINLPSHERFLKRLKDNLNNEDSLIYLSDEYSTIIIDYLLNNNKEKTLAIITSASYIEGLYLALNLITTYSVDNPVIQRIIEQKYAYSNLIAYANKYHGDLNSQVAINLLIDIYKIFEKIPEVENSKSKLERGNDNKMILSGGKKLSLSEKEYIELKSKVSEIREMIVENNLLN